MLVGLLVDRREIGNAGDFEQMTDIGQILEKVRQEAGLEAAQALAKAFGLDVMPGLSCQAEWQGVQVGLIRCASVKARMRAASIVEVEIPADRISRLSDAFIGPQIHLLVLDAAP